MNDTQNRRLWLLRHGETAWNSEGRYLGHSNIALSDAGREQARCQARFLQGRSIAGIYSSDLQRAQETAIAIAEQGGYAPPQVMRDWRELSFGAWEGLRYEQIIEQFVGQTDFFSTPFHAAPPEGESLGQLAERVHRAWSALCQDIRQGSAQEHAGDIVLVSHGGPLRVLLCQLLGVAVERQWQFRLQTGSISAVDLYFPAHQMEPAATLALLNLRAEDMQYQEKDTNDVQAKR